MALLEVNDGGEGVAELRAHVTLGEGAHDEEGRKDDDSLHRIGNRVIGGWSWLGGRERSLQEIAKPGYQGSFGPSDREANRFL